MSERNPHFDLPRGGVINKKGTYEKVIYSTSNRNL